MLKGKLSFSRKAPPVSELVERFVRAWCDRHHDEARPRGPFTLDDAPLSARDLASPAMLLPVVVWHAEGMYRYGINQRGFGAVYRKDEDALVQRAVDLAKVYRSNSEVLCFTLEALEDALRHLPASRSVPGAVDLRTLVDMFVVDMDASPVPAVGSTAPTLLAVAAGPRG